MRTWEEYYTEQQLNEGIIDGLLARIGGLVPGLTTQDKANNVLDTINLALDGAGIVDPTGIVDGTNAVILLTRGIHALATKQPANKYFYDALISAISAVPLGDVMKLLKPMVKNARRGGPVRNVAAMGMQGGRMLQANAKTAIQDRMVN